MKRRPQTTTPLSPPAIRGFRTERRFFHEPKKNEPDRDPVFESNNTTYQCETQHQGASFDIIPISLLYSALMLC